jgi:non-ribosomal peptide synthetase component F
MHKGLHSYCAWWNPYLQSGPHDRVSHLANVGFDASMTETWATLVAGASIFLCSEEIIRLTPKLFIEWVTQHEITVAFLPTVLTEAFVSEQHPPEMKLRCLYTGGDKLHIGPRADARFRLICCYGPCESTIGVTATDVPAGMTAPPFNIGKPQPNVQIHILDPNQKLLPIGTIGEICIGGQQLARGYYNRPDLTRNAFIQNPFKKSTVSSTAMNTNNIVDKHASDASASSGDSIDSYSTSSVLYRTGDLARYLHDGSLEFWGRADFQVKIRGNRIELGEIEGAMRECEGIYDVVVVARTDAKQGNKAVEGEKKIVCYYVWKRSLAPNQQLDSSALRAMLRAKLPEFMIPSAFVNLPALPLTPNGKVDRDALPAPSMDDLATRAHLAPRNEIEEQLAGIVTHLLGVPKVGM